MPDKYHINIGTCFSERRHTGHFSGAVGGYFAESDSEKDRATEESTDCGEPPPRHRYCPSSLSSLHHHCIFPSCHSVIYLFLSLLTHHFSTYFPYLCLPILELSIQPWLSPLPSSLPCRSHPLHTVSGSRAHPTPRRRPFAKNVPEANDIQTPRLRHRKDNPPLNSTARKPIQLGPGRCRARADY